MADERDAGETRRDKQRDHDRDINVAVPLTDFTRQIAREAGFAAAEQVLAGHVANCRALRELVEIKEDAVKLEARVRLTEGRFNMLLGAIIASGGVGGAVGAGILKLFGG